jgi:hypothetical protein
MNNTANSREELLRDAFEMLGVHVESEIDGSVIEFSLLGQEVAKRALVDAGVVGGVLRLLEDALETGSEELRDLVCTGFLERLMTEASFGRFQFVDIDSSLGPRSRAYCHAWDRFTGVTTTGLT